MSQLVQWEKIGSEIELAKDWDEIKGLSDKLAAFKIWAKQSKQSLQTQNKIAEYRLRLERKKGRWLKENGISKQGRKNLKNVGVNGHDPDKPTLSELGITKDESSISQQIDAIPEEKFEEFLSKNKDASELTIAAALRLTKGAQVKNNSGDTEWYTPEKYIESARKVMGRIDLDPASSKQANEIIKAKDFFDEQTDGLKQKWYGCIWLNPPYAQRLVGDFIDKLNTEKYQQAIVLVNNATETKWGQKLLSLSNAVCFHTGRIKFIDPDGAPADAPLQGQMIVYIGKNSKEFSDEFSQYGICLNRVL